MLILSASLMAQISKRLIYTKGEDGFDTYRIPAIVQAKDGTILAFAEARKNSGGDTGDIDLVVKRSSDGGKTWSKIITIWDDADNVCGNPAPVVDRSTGRIILVSTWNKGSDTERAIHARTSEDTRRVFVIFSDDNGLTWSDAHDITDQAKSPEWTWYATGPCHSIQLQSGRIVVPCNHGVYDNGPAGTRSHVIYSDNLGETWTIGGDARIGNESTVVELSGGDLMLNMRSWYGDSEKAGHQRVAAISHDAGKTFGEPFILKGLIEPVCNGSTIDYSPAGVRTGKILFSNPEHPSKRINMTVRMSSDNGATWERVCTLTEGPAAYSDLCVLADGDVVIAYEGGETRPYENITFARIDKKLLHTGPDKTVKLYPEGQSASKGLTENGKVITFGPGVSNGYDGRKEEVDEFGNRSIVGDDARLEFYFPSKPNGQMVVVCPGGGYATVCAVKEGKDVAKWMAQRGIATCVVTYRLPNGHAQVPLTDVQNAFRYCRAHSNEWGINQIGVMGFSAGGHLAAMSSNLYADDITKPDFSILIYPVIDLGHHEGTSDELVGKSKKLKRQYSMQNRITSGTPRTFLALSQNDNVVNIHSSLWYYDKLNESGVKAEMYIFPGGGHGWGFLNEEVGGRTDKLGAYRPLFSESLEKFLSNVKPKD